MNACTVEECGSGDRENFRVKRATCLESAMRIIEEWLLAEQELSQWRRNRVSKQLLPLEDLLCAVKSFHVWDYESMRELASTIGGLILSKEKSRRDDPDYTENVTSWYQSGKICKLLEEMKLWVPSRGKKEFEILKIALLIVVLLDLGGVCNFRLKTQPQRQLKSLIKVVRGMGSKSIALQ